MNDLEKLLRHFFSKITRYERESMYLNRRHIGNHIYGLAFGAMTFDL